MAGLQLREEAKASSEVRSGQTQPGLKLNLYSTQGSLNHYECTVAAGITWKTSITKTRMKEFLDKLGCKSEEELAKQAPTLETLLFLDFFTKAGYYAGHDVFRALHVRIDSIEVAKSDMEIDSSTGKTVINFEVAVVFSQAASEQAVVTLAKTHKQIKHLIRENGLTMPKVK